MSSKTNKKWPLTIIFFRSSAIQKGSEKKNKKSPDEKEEPKQHSMLAKLAPSLHMRRKSSPAIPQLGELYGRKTHHRRKLFPVPSSSQLSSRRLSSPPAFDKTEEEFFNFDNKIKKKHSKMRHQTDDCDRDGSGSSNGSVNKLCISGLNPSSSDLHTIISGHQVLQMHKKV